MAVIASVWDIQRIFHFYLFNYGIQLLNGSGSPTEFLQQYDHIIIA